MNDDDVKSVEQILLDNRMSTRPEYYSGRGATRTDLDGEILSGIRKEVEEHYGEDAAKNFVKMVAGIKVLSATTFLNELYRLSYNGWVYPENKKDESGIAVPKNEDGEYDQTSVMIGMMGIFGAMGNDRDDTELIRGQFLRSNGCNYERGRRYHMHPDGHSYYYED